RASGQPCCRAPAVEYRRLAQRADDHRGLNCQYGLGRTLTKDLAARRLLHKLDRRLPLPIESARPLSCSKISSVSLHTSMPMMIALSCCAMIPPLCETTRRGLTLRKLADIGRANG